MTNTEIINFLKSQGFKVNVWHLRYSLDDDSSPKRKILFYRSQFRDHKLIDPRGGETRIQIITPVGVIKESAHCSYKDNYKKSDGLTLALDRLMNKMKTMNLNYNFSGAD